MTRLHQIAGNHRFVRPVRPAERAGADALACGDIPGGDQHTRSDGLGCHDRGGFVGYLDGGRRLHGPAHQQGRADGSEPGDGEHDQTHSIHSGQGPFRRPARAKAHLGADVTAKTSRPG